MMDVAGQDATDSFEDVGHSDEAREILEGLKIGTLKRLVCGLQAQTRETRSERTPPCRLRWLGLVGVLC